MTLPARAARRRRLSCCVAHAALAVWLVGGVSPTASAQDAAGAATAPARAAGETTFLVENVTRAEAWRFFAPLPGGGTEPDYVFVGNRATLGARYDGRRWRVRGAIQYVRLENLPVGAIGPGLLGHGGAYFFQAAGTFSYQLYLRGLSVSLTSAGRTASIEAGRLSTATDDGSTAPAGVDRLAADRAVGRLLGDMDDTLYQRAWDGVRGRLRRGGWDVAGAALVPTQGTFEESANLPMARVRVFTGDVVRRASPSLRLHAFAYGYHDTRAVHARPDNSGRSAGAADVAIATLGGSAAATRAHGHGAWDGLAWTAVQSGDWYGQPHRAWSAAAEGGYRWAAVRGRPWLRSGLVYASGDEDRADGRHGTFFPMLPAADRFVRSGVYAHMNARDLWSELRVAPHARVDAQLAVHRVDLASADDRWYVGSGATERRGSYFGYLGRDTRGATGLGTIVEGGIEWRPHRWWTLRGYVAAMRGGDAVAATFADRQLLTTTLDVRLRF